jgi:hypothetical protein
MIPNHFSLVAVNPFQQAVQLAIIDVESSLMAGKRLGRFPWAMALLRRLRGAGRPDHRERCHVRHVRL